VPPLADRNAASAPAAPLTGWHAIGPDIWLALSLCLLFVVQGVALIPYQGLQLDECLFSMGLYEPVFAERGVHLFGHVVPIMVMSYIGALKMWIYALIFPLWPPSAYSVRVPMVLAGAATIWFFFLLVRRTCGAKVALAGCLLLTFDTTYILTTTFDWGPVAIQHLLLMAGALCIVRYCQLGGLVNVGVGFFLFGLALWDKAIFVWILVGLGAATLAVFPRELFSRLNWRSAALAILCFLAGAAPLVHYNRTTGFKTFTGNVQYSAVGLDGKLNVLRAALEGNSMFGYMVREEPAPQRGQASSPVEEASVAVSHWLDEPRTGLLFLASALTLALLPWLWSTPARKPILFSLVFTVVTWFQMALNQNTGGSTHHIVLLWPFPHLAVAAALTQATLVFRRFAPLALAVLLATIAGSNLLVTNQHAAQLIERGPTTVWTDAIYPLADAMKQVPAKRVYVMDWGMFDSLRVLDEGQLPLWVGGDTFGQDAMTPEKRREALEMLAMKDAVFLGHTDGNEVFPGVSGRLRAFAEAAGYRKETIKIVGDHMGRPIFEIYRWTPGPAPTSAPVPQP